MVMPEAARRALSAMRWPLTAVLALIAVALGWIGFEESATASGHASSATTGLYHALQLFELHMAEVPEPVPWQLDVARFLAPALTLFAAASAVLALVGGQLDRLRARRSSGHVIVCGLGDLGTRAARSLRAAGHHVVAIAPPSEASAIAVCRAGGIIVVIGDATDPETLRLAGVARARYLLALTGEDDANAKIAIDARRLVGNREGPPLTCFIQVADRSLVGMLERLGVSGSGDRRIRVEALNVFDLAARTILDRYPAFDGDGMTPHGPPLILVVGSGQLGGRLIAEAARRWQSLPAGGDRRLRVLLVDRNARRAAKSFAERYPGLNATCEIEARDAAPSWAGLVGEETPTTVYVCLGDDAASFNAALTIRRRLGDPAVPIVVETTQEGGASAFVADDSAHPIRQEIDIVAVLDLVSDPAVLLNGQNETIARAIHARYLEGQRLAGVETGTTIPWERLSESMRESNRRQAADIGRKLQAIGCVIEPLADSTNPSVELTSDEIEGMAVLEHDRWMTDRRADGWRPAAIRDDANKMTPYLVPYPDLPEAIKDIDRTFVRDIPVRLATIGFAIRRIARSGAAPVPPAPAGS